MTKSEAFARIRELLGDDCRRISYRGMPRSTSPMSRKRASRRLLQLRERRGELGKEIDEQLRASGAYRYQFYERDGMFSHQVARGDTWEEALEQLAVYKRLRAGGLGVLAASLKAVSAEARHEHSAQRAAS